MCKKTIVVLCTFVVVVFFFKTAVAGIADWDIVIDEITFKPGQIYSYDAITLSNGNAVIAYYDMDDKQGEFVIYDANGVEVIGETTFNYDPVGDVNMTGLNNGNFLIAYQQDSIGRFVIYNDQGGLVKSETIFKTGRMGLVSIATMANGNVFMAYRDNTDYDGKFVIFDDNGDLVIGETVYYSGTSGGMHVIALENGNALIAYVDGPGDELEFVIYDNTGNMVKNPTVFNSDDSSGIFALALNNGNVLISYVKRPSPYTGHLVIIDSDGNPVVDEIDLNLSGSVDRIASTVLSNGYVLTTYRRGDGSDNSGSFVILDSDGNMVRGRTLFYSGVINNRFPVTMGNGNVMAPFWEGSSPYHSKFANINNPVLNPSDLDKDGDVDGDDLALLKSGYGTSYDAEDLEHFAWELGYLQ